MDGCHVPLDALRRWGSGKWEWVVVKWAGLGPLSTDNCANMANRTNWQSMLGPHFGTQKVYHHARYVSGLKAFQHSQEPTLAQQ